MYFNNRVRRTLVLVATIVAGTLGAAGAALATAGPETSSNRAQFAAVAVSVPTAPRAPTATAGHVSVNLAWLAPSSTGGAAIDKYLVQRAVAGGTWQNIAYPTTRSYTAAGLTNGTRYYFRVRAHNAAGWSPFSTAVNAVPRMYAGTIVTGEGAGGTPQVAVVDGSTGVRLSSFLAYQSTFAGGVRVAVGDVTGDGVDDIVTGAGPGGAPQVKVFDGVTGAQIRSFLGGSAASTGGVYLTASQQP